MQLSKKLVRRMKELGLSQRELARKADMTQQTISKYATGQGLPTYSSIMALSEALQVPPVWFFEDIDLERFSEYGSQLMGVTARATEPRTPEDRFTNQDKLVIGHWYPMRRLPSPFQGYARGMTAYLYDLLCNSLVQRRQGRWYEELASDWKQVKDGWLFQLRSGVLFHDGTPLTAEDVRWSYVQHLHHNPADRRILGVHIVDDETVVIRTAGTCQLAQLAMPVILPMASQELPLGTGPFILVEKEPTSWTLRANPYYFRGEPYLKEMVVQEYSDADALEEALLRGEVDYAHGIYVLAEGLIAEVVPDFQRYQLHFRLDKPQVQDVNLRRAIALGLDRVALAEAAGLKSPLYSGGAFDTHLGDASTQPLPPDVEKARQLLARNPEACNTPLRIIHYFPIDGEDALVDELVRQLQELGFSVELGEPAHLMFTTRAIGDLSGEMRHWLSEDRFNLSAYSNPNVDKQIRTFLASGPTSEQLRELRAMIQRDVPDIPLFYNETGMSYMEHLHVRDGGVPTLERLFEVHNWYIESE